MSTYDDRWTKRFEASQKRLALKERAIAYMGGSCRLCAYEKCPQALEFHHLDPRTKDFEISSKMSWSKITVELEKTILVCSNCHKEIHAGIYPTLVSQEDGESEGLYNVLML